MRYLLAVAAGVVVLSGAPAVARAKSAAPDCSLNPLQVSLSNSTRHGPTVRLTAGDSQSIVITGTPYATPTPSPSPLLVRTLPATSSVLGQPVPEGATVTVQPPAARDSTAPPVSAPLPQTAAILDPRIATIPTAVPTTAPGPGGLVVPSTAYTVKGTAQGNTELYVAEGVQGTAGFRCTVVGVAVRSKERLVLTTGFGMSYIPKNTFTTVTVPVPDAPSLPTPTPPPGVYVYKTESSSTQTSLPILGSYRLNDAPNVDVYASFGYFTSGDANGPVFGVSVGSGQLLFTMGSHSSLLTDYSPYVNQANHRVEFNGAATFAALPTTVSTRRRQIFFAVTVPASLITGLLSGGSHGASSDK
ncbi:MAG: hypothetical protein QOI11_2125 [Candidatus Eremiobacteraeota bacterium]|nr:hypothetical protein [Candidatus Eremiobacteraeota bacterium]